MRLHETESIVCVAAVCTRRHRHALLKGLLKRKRGEGAVKVYIVTIATSPFSPPSDGERLGREKTNELACRESNL